MNISDEIIAARKCGVVHYGLSSLGSPSISELAAEFGLASDAACYTEIDSSAARRLVRMILNQDLAYNYEIIPNDRAAELADRFLDQFGIEGVKFYSNGNFHEARRSKVTQSGTSWNPATDATFDTGVLICGPMVSGCLWVEDED